MPLKVVIVKSLGYLFPSVAGPTYHLRLGGVHLKSEVSCPPVRLFSLQYTDTKIEALNYSKPLHL